MSILLALVINIFLFGFFAVLTWLAGVPIETRLQDPINATLLFGIMVFVIIISVVMEWDLNRIARIEKHHWHVGKRNED